MSAAIPAAAHAAPAPTAGAWIGVGVAARGVLTVAFGVVPVVVVAGVTMVVTYADEMARSDPDIGSLGPEANRLLGVLMEFVDALRPVATAFAVAATAIGVALFAAGVMLARGSETGRRFARGLLLVDALRAVASSVAMAVLFATTLSGWLDRYQEAVAAIVAAAPGAGRSPMFRFHVPAELNIASDALGCVFGLAVAGLLFWAAGRPSARRWCAARSANYPVASGR